MQISYALAEINAAAETLWQWGHQRRIWLFDAPMGAGKTTLIAALCKTLKTGTEAASPTYAIINEYALPDGRTLAHMDWYRLRDEEEAMQAGVEEYLLRRDCLCFIEWPERAGGLLAGMEVAIVRIENPGEGELRISAKVAGYSGLSDSQ